MMLAHAPYKVWIYPNVTTPEAKHVTLAEWLNGFRQLLELRSSVDYSQPSRNIYCYVNLVAISQANTLACQQTDQKQVPFDLWHHYPRHGL